MDRIYLDYAASTPVGELVLQAMEPLFAEKFGNPSSLHSFGQEAMAAIDLSREAVAKAIGADFREIIFTSSATEANNLALRGTVKSIKYKVSSIKRPRIIVSSIEHESVLETARDLEKEGVEVIYLPVDKRGVVNLEKLRESLNENTVLISVMYINNVVGSIQPITEISKVVRNFREESGIRNQELGKKKNPLIHNSSFILPLLHTDAVQALQYLDCDVNKLGVDLMSISSHKIYGPKGAGALYIRNHESGIKNQGNRKASPTINNSSFILPIITGGGQEFGLRSSTENVPAIVGFAKAVELVVKNRDKERKMVEKLRDRFWKKLKSAIPNIKINGIMNHESGIKGEKNKKSIIHNSKFMIPRHIAPHIINISFPEHSSQDLIVKFDIAGVAASSGAACSVRSAEVSYVLKAMNIPDKQAKSSVRFSFGRDTTNQDVDEAVKRMRETLRN